MPANRGETHGPAGECVVFPHHLVGARSGGGDGDLDSAAVEPNVRAEGVRVDGVGTGGDRLVHQLLHGQERVGGLGGPAPVDIGPCVVGDGGQLSQRVSTT